MNRHSGDFAYAVSLYREDGSSLGQRPVDVDFEPAVEWTRFQGLRMGLMGEDAFHAHVRVEPLWHPERREPELSGFRVEVGGADVAHAFPTSYFLVAAEEAGRRLVEEGVLREGERFRYRALAFPVERAPEARGGRFQSTPARPRLPVEGGELPAYLARSRALAEVGGGGGRLGGPDQGLLAEAAPPVFVRRQILDETRELADTAGGRETGGVLIGHLRRDRSVPEVFVDVTAQVPAEYAEGEASRLSFTPEAWTAVRAAIELRRREEIMVGWWHSHPAREWCKECDAERQAVCPFATGFLSTHDEALHRTVFPRAFSVALVVTLPAEGPPTHSLFGWHEGGITRRPYHVLSPETPDIPHGLVRTGETNRVD